MNLSMRGSRLMSAGLLFLSLSATTGCVPLVNVEPAPQNSGCEWAAPNYLSEDTNKALYIGEHGIPDDILLSPEWAALIARFPDDPAIPDQPGDTLTFLSGPHAPIGEDVDFIGKGNIIYERICPNKDAAKP